MDTCSHRTASGRPCKRAVSEGVYCSAHSKKVKSGRPPVTPTERAPEAEAPRPPPLLRTASAETQKAILELVGESPKAPNRPFGSKSKQWG